MQEEFHPSSSQMDYWKTKKEMFPVLILNSRFQQVPTRKARFLFAKNPNNMR
jgi:hypothetical protein